MKKLFSKSSGIALSLAAVAGLLLTGCNKEETVLLPGDAGVITQTTQDDGSVLLSVDEIANAETYNWYKDGASVQNTDSRTYLALESGVYKVAGVNANGEGKPSGEVDVEVALVEPEPEEFNILTKEYIPDDAFREYIKTEIAGKDEYTNIEAASYDGSIILTKSEISDLTGIGYFTSLPVLSFTDNAALQYLDLSANKALEVIDLWACEALVYLNIDGLDKVETLNLSETGLGDFDLSRYEDALGETLKTLNLDYLSNISEINLKPFSNLENVSLSYTALSSLDVSGMTKLKSLWASIILSLRSLNVSGCTALEELVCSYCDLSSLDLSTNNNLSVLAIQQNPLGNVELSHLKNLTFLNISYTERTEMVDLSGFDKLVEIECQSNDFSGTVLDLSDCPLTRLRCESTGIVGLDISSSTGMYEMYCYSNELERLDISMCTGLEYLFCEDNPMTEIKVWPEFDISNPPFWWQKDEHANYVYEFGVDPGIEPEDPSVPEEYRPWIGTWNVHATQTLVWVQDPEDPYNKIPEFRDEPMDMTVEIEWSEDRYMLAFYGWSPYADDITGTKQPAYAMQDRNGSGMVLCSGLSSGSYNSSTLMWYGVGQYESGEAGLIAEQFYAYTMTMDGDTVAFEPYHGERGGESYTVNALDLFGVEDGMTYPVGEKAPAGELTMTRVK